MKLPKRDLPNYEISLPYSNRRVSVRPYTVKEERILSMAAQSKDESSVREAMKQIVENCTDAVYEELTNADFEFLYLKLVAISVSNVSNIVINYECDKPECPSEHPTAVNLDHVRVVGIDEMFDQGMTKKRDYWVIPFDENSGICMRLKLSGETPADTIFASTVNVYDADGVYDEFTKEELLDYLDCLKPEEFVKIRNFINNQPYCSIPVDGKCKTCGKEIRLDTKGVLDFLA